MEATVLLYSSALVCSLELAMVRVCEATIWNKKCRAENAQRVWTQRRLTAQEMCAADGAVRVSEDEGLAAESLTKRIEDLGHKSWSRSRGKHAKFGISFLSKSRSCVETRGDLPCHFALQHRRRKGSR